MSRETLEDLNIHTLIGQTDARGTAWHYRAEHQGEETNHYPGSIPVADVERRLFHWEAVSRRVAVETPADVASMTHLSEAGDPVRWQAVDDRQAICRDDTDTVMGIFTGSYEKHQYAEWLLTTVADIPRRRPLDQLCRAPSSRRSRLGRGLDAGCCNRPRRNRVPPELACHHLLRRLHCHHLQTHLHPCGLRQHEGDGTG
jgi:hypothetical protein